MDPSNSFFVHHLDHLDLMLISTKLDGTWNSNNSETLSNQNNQSHQQQQYGSHPFHASNVTKSSQSTRGFNS